MKIHHTAERDGIMTRSPWIVILCCIVWIAFHHAAAAHAQVELTKFLDSHCADCHSGATAERELDLMSLAMPVAEPESLRQWSMIYHRVAEHQMPPFDHDQPDTAARQQFLEALSQLLTTVESEVRRANGRSGIRRLSRVEFEASLRDLLHLPQIELASMLPSDGMQHGLAKSAGALETSHVQMAKFVEAIDEALQAAVAPTFEQPETEVRRVTCRELSLIKVQFQQTKAVPMIGHQRDETFLVSDGNFAKRQPGWTCDPPPHFDGVLTLMYRPENINGLAPSHSGFYRLRVRAFGMNWDRGRLLPGTRHEALSLYTEAGHVATFDMPPNEPATREAIVWLNAGERFSYAAASLAHKNLNFATRGNKYDLITGPALVLQWFEIEGPLHDQWPPASHQALFDDLTMLPADGRQANAGGVSISGQIDASQADVQAGFDQVADSDKPTTSKRQRKRTKDEDVPPVPFPEYELNARTFPKDVPLKQIERNYELRPEKPISEARRLLARFLQRACCRPTRPEDFELPMAAFRRQHKLDGDFVAAMLAAYRAVLVSPDFLLVGTSFPPKTDENADNDGPLPGDCERDCEGDCEVARRLSLFLWNSVPDEELQRLARQQQLRDPAVLQQQTERMLKHPRSQRFIDHLCDYWLSLKDAELTEPDEDLYPEYSQLTLESMLAETRSYVAEMVRRDLPVRYVVDSDFLMLNTRLAELYGLPSPDTFAVRAITLQDRQHRGGLLTQAAILKVTANGTTTSPVTRGAWVLEHLLGRTPPPPPPSVPAIEPDLTGATTVRQQLQAHRQDASCASCHRLIDPPGFALESFDVMGAWRERYRSTESGDSVTGTKDNKPLQYKLGLPVEAFGELPDGRAFSDIDEFRALLLKNERTLAENLLKRLVVCATGAPVSFADEPEFQAIMKTLEQDGYPVRQMIHAIIHSRMFQQR
jgi:hypothetical protein